MIVPSWKEPLVGIPSDFKPNLQAAEPFLWSGPN
jgi:hypothetical protein